MKSYGIKSACCILRPGDSSDLIGRKRLHRKNVFAKTVASVTGRRTSMPSEAHTISTFLLFEAKYPYLFKVKLTI